MNHRVPAAVLLAAALTAAASLTACSGGSSPTGPSSSAPPNSTPAPSVASLSGTVRAFENTAITGALVTILDGPNAGKSATTTTGGAYSFVGLTAGAANISAARSDLGFTTQTQSGVISAGSMMNFVLQAPVFSTSGTGANVFNMPVYVARVRIQGAFGGYCENFVVRINSSLIVNEILGACSVGSGPRFDGTFLVPNKVLTLPGQTVQVTESTGLNWTVSEVR